MSWNFPVALDMQSKCILHSSAEGPQLVNASESRFKDARFPVAVTVWLERLPVSQLCR